LAEVGLSGTHFHDLRHTGNVLTAAAGASLRELMDRMGHSSARAALIYLHGSDARQRVIADGVSKLAERDLRSRKPGQPERARARDGHEMDGRRRTEGS
jgi:hypothetical protein